METNVSFPFDKDIPDIRDTRGIHPFSTFNSSTARLREVRAIVAMGLGNEIGFHGDMPWHIPEDLRHFKSLTMGHPVIMGRATWLSLPKKPLPGRRNIVLSRQPDFFADGADIASSVGAAVAICQPPAVPFIIGGGKVYEAALPLITHIDVTRIDARFPDADTFFPEINSSEWNLSEVSEQIISSCGLSFRYETYTRRQ